MRTKAEAIEIAGTRVAPGSRQTLDIPIAKLYTHTPVVMPVHIIHGRRPGPKVFVCAGIHGDEINGVETARRLIKSSALRHVRGTLLIIPVVNVWGFLNKSRYLPDRRDLNRSFPGSPSGSMAARLADAFLQLVKGFDCGIDLHTAAIYRTNLPQIRCDLKDERTQTLSEAFGAPVVLHAPLRPGSLRETLHAEGHTPVLVYEAGEALRFDEVSIRAGTRGVINVLRQAGMIPSKHAGQENRGSPMKIYRSSWVRAPESGLLHLAVKLGSHVSTGQILGQITDPYGSNRIDLYAPYDGVIIGTATLPLVNEGEAIIHIGCIEAAQAATLASELNAFDDQEDPFLPPWQLL
ncbi:hypothetical protein SAMN05443662_1503 [Sulfurivirga caldicuralii]|uniref:Succinylglutamate desuccinylase/Aspartoacylase catalytic domain-containing protein n=1 Tax=Sulfurivirga caldicuralii TaxID=364032 RepID=A0A1N6GUI8_9GAMM|nr:succinylglutamate desuccinylase/aspartoacylase family protein [Sulfurivirga caldicuralii]SIO11186.1 hypothetical protein SAMN05443662_1503 [Sulfurivirga caldicuralii]